MKKNHATAALALLMLAGTAHAETYRDFGIKPILNVNNQYKDYTGVAVPNILPGDEVQVICDGQFTLPKPDEVTISSRSLAIQVDGVTISTVLPTARVSWKARDWPVNRTGIWVSQAFYTDVIFVCEYKANSPVRDLDKLLARTTMWVSRKPAN